MKNFYYKFEKIIKITFWTIITAIVLIVPVILLITSDEYEKKFNLKDPVIEITLTESKDEWHTTLNGENTSDFNIEVNTSAFNNWNVSDYYLIVTPNNFDYVNIDPSVEMIWTPYFENNNKIKSSLAYKTLSKTQYDDAEDETELIDAIKNSKQFKNDSAYEVENVKVSDGKQRIFAAVEFTNPYSETNEIITKKTFKINNSSSAVDFYDFSVKPDKVDGGIELNIENISLLNYNERKKEFSKFIYDGKYTRVDNLRNTFSPKIMIDGVYEDENKWFNNEWIYKTLPTVEMQIYATNDKPSNPVSSDDVLIYDGINTINYDWSTNYIIMDEQKVTSYADQDPDVNLYDDNNELLYNDVKIVGELYWEFNTEEKIKNLITTHNSEIKEDLITINLPSDSNRSIEFGTIDEPAKINEQEMFYNILQFDKSNVPNYVVYPNWDENDLFNLVVATNEKYIFDSDKYSEANSNIQFIVELTHIKTGEIFKTYFRASEFNEYEETGIYYEVMYPQFNIPRDDYYINYSSKESLQDESNVASEGIGISMREFRNYSKIKPSYLKETITNNNESYLYQNGIFYSNSGTKRSILFRDFNVVNNIEEIDMESPTVLLPDEISLQNSQLQNDIALMIIIIVILTSLMIVPTIFVVYLVFKK